MTTALALLLVLLCTAATAASVVAVYRVTAPHPAPRGRRGSPPVTVLKPLCGADDDLEANLESFFRQDYPHLEILFGVEGAEDPAIAVVQRLRARFPGVAARLVVHDGKRGLNPKVSNLRAMLEAGAHDVVLISDSNVAVAPDYVAGLVAELTAEPRVGLVTSLFVGVGERTLGATLENLHLAGPIAGSVAITAAFSEQAAAIGKSMLFRRSVFDRLGGLASVASVLAEDFVMGRMFAAAGWSVRVSPTPVDNVCRTTTVRQFLRRHQRWGLLRSRVTPLVYPFEPLFNPMAIALTALALGAGPLALAWGVGLTFTRDALQWTRLRGSRGLAAALPLGPFKELVALGLWAVAPFTRRVGWRGRRYRIAAGTRLYAEAPQGPPEQLLLVD